MEDNEKEPEVKVIPKYTGMCPKMLEGLENIFNPIQPYEEVKPLELPEKGER